MPSSCLTCAEETLYGIVGKMGKLLRREGKQTQMKKLTRTTKMTKTTIQVLDTGALSCTKPPPCISQLSLSDAQLQTCWQEHCSVAVLVARPSQSVVCSQHQ